MATLLDWLEEQNKMTTITKTGFGEFMHDSANSEEEKQAMLDRVAEAGGYDALAD